MNHLQEIREEKIQKLGLSENLLKLTRGEYVHEDLEFRCEEPKYYLENESFSPSGKNFTPLWEADSSITGFFLENDKSVFIKLYADDVEDFQIIGESKEDLIEYLVTEYAEDEEELRNLLQKGEK